MIDVTATIAATPASKSPRMGDKTVTVSIRSDDPDLIAAVRRVLRVALGSRRARLEVSAKVGFGLEPNADIVVLDWRSPGAALGAGPPLGGAVAVVVAADALQAFEAYQCGVCDYLVAPISTERLATAFERATLLAIARHGASPPVGTVHQFPERLCLRACGRLLPVRVVDVACLESEAPFVVVHTGDQVIRVRDQLTRLESLLDPNQFARIHRGAIVRIDQIAELIRRERGDFDLRLKSGLVTRLSRRRAGELKRAIR